jgi:DNA polymerase elongation subunit (family B)
VSGKLSEKDGVYSLKTEFDGVVKVNKDNVESIKDTYSDFMKSILDGLQLAYKVVCNSLYGQTGASTSPICLKELAASTTAAGRGMLILARKEVLTAFPKSECVYGDSVTAETPVLVKRDNEIKYIKISELADNWSNCVEDGKSIVL